MTKWHPGHQVTDEELGYPTEPNGRIPSFSNREEEAAFWDSIDPMTLIGAELKPIEITIGGRFLEQLRSRLQEDDRVHLESIARARGVAPSRLVEMWVKERLDAEVAKAS